MLFFLIVSVLSATAKSESDSRRGRASGAAERQRAVGDSDAAETPGGGLPKLPRKDTTEWLD